MPKHCSAFKEKECKRRYYEDSNIYLTVYLDDGEYYCASYTTSRDIYALEEITKLLKDKEKTVNSRDLQDFIGKHDFSDEELKVISRLFEK